MVAGFFTSESRSRGLRADPGWTVTRFFDSGDGGSRTHAPLRTYRISSATSYDHLSTSPERRLLCAQALGRCQRYDYIAEKTVRQGKSCRNSYCGTFQNGL